MIFTSNIKHPKEFSITSGKTELVQEVKAINQSIELNLCTALGEMYGDPGFGSKLYEFVHDYVGSSLVVLIKSEVVRVLSQREPRVYLTEEDVTVSENSSTVSINIRYRIKYSNYNAESNILIKREENQWII